MKRRANPNDIIRKHREQFRGGISHFTSLAEIQVEASSARATKWAALRSDEIRNQGGGAVSAKRSLTQHSQWVEQNPAPQFFSIRNDDYSGSTVRFYRIRSNVNLLLGSTITRSKVIASTVLMSAI